MHVARVFSTREYLKAMEVVVLPPHSTVPSAMMVRTSKCYDGPKVTIFKPCIPFSAPKLSCTSFYCCRLNNSVYGYHDMHLKMKVTGCPIYSL